MHAPPPRFGAFQVRRALKATQAAANSWDWMDALSSIALDPGCDARIFLLVRRWFVELNKRRGEFVFDKNEEEWTWMCPRSFAYCWHLVFPCEISSYQLRLLSALCLPSLPPHASFVCRMDLMKPHDTSGYARE
ncbi:hypothetical protein H0G86_012440 [Trichoderma simmonsii]|uniref:Uncharacterized protein n=1 Tax=Trichoderma simmonsii TaxID=1491479 RepID=A0A8G0LTJ1_9HYPO|nr:hypothetical protein H0G86_012440 [Trichoderma simmonsii]